jgi:hypothetical protein
LRELIMLFISASVVRISLTEGNLQGNISFGSEHASSFPA